MSGRKTREERDELLTVDLLEICISTVCFSCHLRLSKVELEDTVSQEASVLNSQYVALGLFYTKLTPAFAYCTLAKKVIWFVSR